MSAWVRLETELVAGSSPAVIYNIWARETARTTTTVNIEFEIQARLQNTGSTFGTGFTLTFLANVNNGTNGSVVLKSSTQTWSGTTVNTRWLTVTGTVGAADTSCTLRYWTTREAGGGTTGVFSTRTATMPIGSSIPGACSWYGWDGVVNNSTSGHPGNIRRTIRCSWGAATGATSYRIQRKRLVNSVWVDYGTVIDTGSNTFWDWNPINDPPSIYWYNAWGANSAGSGPAAGPWNGFHRGPARVFVNNGSWTIGGATDDKGVYVNNNGTWTPARSIWVNDNGTWRQTLK